LIDKAADEPLQLQQITDLAPFLDGHTDAFVQEANIEQITWDALPGIAPFVKEETLVALINKVGLKDVQLKYLIGIAPFLGNQLDPLLNEVEISTLTPEDLAEIAPFVKKETLASLMESLAK
ncbi:hypothetical protein, partial [Virgibacillus sp. DJP39]|uniref:hypothetical protein n=1 Tax=Virgibacillus sp. DJP39 TaxID=3409790 RepID=UPI003BB69EDB